MRRYIDADKLIDKYERAIEDEWNKKTSPSSWADAYDCVIADIDDVPTADVEEVRHGEWVFDFTLNGDDFYHCSICDRQEVLNGLCNERNIATHLPYCHCGAKMDGERREG